MVLLVLFMPFNGIYRVHWRLRGNPCPQCLTRYNDSNFRLLIYIWCWPWYWFVCECDIDLWMLNVICVMLNVICVMLNVIYYVERDIVLLNVILLILICQWTWYWFVVCDINLLNVECDLDLLNIILMRWVWYTFVDCDLRCWMW